MASRRNSAAVGAVGLAGAGAAAAPRPVLPRPAVNRSSVVPLYVVLVIVPTKAGLTLMIDSPPPPPPQPARSMGTAHARTMPSVRTGPVMTVFSQRNVPRRR